MHLQQELGLRVGFEEVSHEGLLNIYYTASRIKKRASEFFRQHNLTDVQFNLMMLLQYQGGEEGLSQVNLSRMMLVNRANITSLIDRMERSGLVTRSVSADDRRYNLIRLTPQGKKMLLAVEDAYMKEIKRIMGAISPDELKTLMALLERIRSNIGAIGEDGDDEE